MVESNFTSNGTGREAFNDLKFSHVYTFSGSAPYMRLVDTETGLIWDNTNSEMVESPTWADTDVLLIDKTATVGGWYINVPAVEDGIYDVLIYDTSGAAVVTDTVTIGKQMLIKDGQIFVMQSK